jgi:hypothetical protein
LLFTNDDFLRVSADTKTCGSPLYPAPAGGLCLPSGKHAGIITQIQAKVNTKTAKKVLFWPAFSIEIRTISPIISIKRAEFPVLMGIAV